MSANNKEPVLIAGELADIELPIAPPTNWEWLVAFLGWTFLLLVLAILLVWSLRNSQVIKGSILWFFWQARWRLKAIERALNLTGDRGTELALKKQAIELYEWCANMQKVNTRINKHFLATSALFAEKEGTSLHISSLDEQTQQIEQLSKQLNFILFAAPEVSRETLFNDLQHSLQLAFEVLNKLPWKNLLKRQLVNKWLRSKNYLKNVFNNKTLASSQVSNKPFNTLQKTKQTHALKQDKHAD